MSGWVAETGPNHPGLKQWIADQERVGWHMISRFSDAKVFASEAEARKAAARFREVYDFHFVQVIP